MVLYHPALISVERYLHSPTITLDNLDSILEDSFPPRGKIFSTLRKSPAAYKPSDVA